MSKFKTFTCTRCDKKLAGTKEAAKHLIEHPDKKKKK